MLGICRCSILQSYIPLLRDVLFTKIRKDLTRQNPSRDGSYVARTGDHYTSTIATLWPVRLESLFNREIRCHSLNYLVSVPCIVFSQNVFNKEIKLKFCSNQFFFGKITTEGHKYVEKCFSYWILLFRSFYLFPSIYSSKCSLAIFAKHSKLNKKHNTTYILDMILSV